MRHLKFKELARRNEELCARDQAAYLRGLSLFASLGAFYYAVAVSFLPLAALACLLAAWLLREPSFLLFALFFASLFVFAGFRGLFLKALPPPGLEVFAKDFPALFKEIDAVSGRLSAPAPSHVLLDGGMNAMVAWTPGRWLFGEGESYLVLGVPLMASMGKEELRAILAHEFGHISKASPASMRRLRRVADSWRQVKAVSDAGGGLTRRLCLGLFADWFLPRLEARLSALSRMQELEADAMSVKIAGKAASAKALLVSAFESKRALHEVAGPYWEGARRSKTMPSEGPLPALMAALRVKRPSKDDLKSLAAASSGRRASGGDSHPSLGERLAKMNFDPDSLSAPEAQDSACVCFGDSESSLVSSLDAAWRETSAPVWAGLNEEALRAKRGLSEMLKLDFSKGLTLDMELKRAQLLELAEGRASARQAFEDILSKSPDCALAKLCLGRLKAMDGDGSGASMALEAVKAEPSLIEQGAPFLFEYFKAEGMDSEYEQVAALWEARLDELSGAASAKPVALPKSFESHKLDGPSLDAVLKALKGNGNVAKAYLVFARFQEGESFHALIVARKFSLLAFRGENDEGLSKELSKSLPADLGVRVLPYDHCSLLAGWRVRRVKGSMIFDGESQ